MRKIKVVVLLVQQLQHGFTKNAKVSPNLTVAHMTNVYYRCFAGHLPPLACVHFCYVSLILFILDYCYI